MPYSPRDLSSFYQLRNSMEEKDLKSTLAKLDEEKQERLSRYQKEKDLFNESHSKHLFSLQCDRLQSRKRWTRREQWATHTEHTPSGKSTNLRKPIESTVRVTKQTLLSKPVKSQKQTRNNSIRFPSIATSITKSDTGRIKHATVSSETLMSHEEHNRSAHEQETKPEYPTQRKRKVMRVDSKQGIKNMDIPVSKLDLFRQFSHRVRRMSTWCYLLRDVFDRLSHENEYMGYNMHKESKTYEQMYGELKSCRYLRMPSDYFMDRSKMTSECNTPKPSESDINTTVEYRENSSI